MTSEIETTMLPQSAGNSPVGWTPDFWRRGVQVSEAAITYAIYIMILVGAVAGAVYIYGAIAGSKVQADTAILARTIQGLFAADAKYEGLTVKLMAESDRLPEQLIAGTEDEPEIWVGGQQGAFPVALFPGDDTADNVSATSNRFFAMVVGNLDVPVRDVDVCVELATLDAAGLRGVHILAAADVGETIPTADTADPPESDGDETPNVAWNVVEGRGGLLKDRLAASVQLSCQEPENKMIVYGFN